MTTQRQYHGFSLMEVIIAVGLFAGSIMAVMSLLPALARQGGAMGDSLAAQRLAGALHGELKRQAVQDFAGLVARIPVMSGPLTDGSAFVADHSAARLQVREIQVATPGFLPEAEQYYLVECWQFPAAPLQADPQGNHLALTVRVSWPYRLPGASDPTAADTRSQFIFATAINR